MKILENIIPIPYQGTDSTYEIKNLPNITKIIIPKTIGNKIIIILWYCLLYMSPFLAIETIISKVCAI